MAISEREHLIKVLESLLSHYKAREKCEGYYDSTLKDYIEALQYALSSLKTDLKYDLMYEGEEIYTKADILAMLEDLLMEIKHTVTMEEDTSSNEDLVKRNNVMKVVQFRIDKLREHKDAI